MPTSPLASATRPHRILARIVVVGAVTFVAWHVFASFLWIAPPTPIRQLIPGDLLTRYMIPFYGQSWSVFAPEPINGDYTLRIRALEEREDGTFVETEWIDATAAEQQLAHHNLLPPRAAGLAWQVASRLKTGADGLNADQRAVIALNYFKEDWVDRLEADLVVEETSAGSSAVFAEADLRATRYATQVAHAVWGDDVVRVQYEATRQNIVPFGERNDPNAQRPAPVIIGTGWRGELVAPGQSESQFAAVFLPLARTEAGTDR